MSTDRTAQLSPEELALKLATREAVIAAGGQVFVAGEVGRSQGVVSDWGSPQTAAFAPLNAVRRIEALGAGKPGHPHVTRALARAQGLRLGGAMPESDNVHLSDWLCDLTGEHADVVRALASARSSLKDLSLNQRAALAREIDQLVDVLAALRAGIEAPDTS